MEIESVGNHFNELDFEKTRIQSWLLLEELSSRIRPGMAEEDAHKILIELETSFGVEKRWHPPKIRFSQNTLKSFREPSEKGVVLKENDLFFLDLGPVFNSYEGDVGKTFCLGNDPEIKKMIAACEELFQITSNEWKEKNKKGHELYEFAYLMAEKMGYRLVLEGGNGHRISEFPHALYHKGSLADFKNTPHSCRWILEIQIHHKSLPMGAFFEDVLS